MAIARDSATNRQIRLERLAPGRYTWRLVTASVPDIGDHDVLIRVHAVSMQLADIEALASAIPEVADASADRTGQIAGLDAAGEIIRVGRHVRNVSVGDRVVGLPYANYTEGQITKEKLDAIHGFSLDGVFADYIRMEDTAIAPMPTWATWAQAAALVSSGLTAWSATGALNVIRKGDTVVIEGTGGVSLFALQFAVASGAHAIVISRSDSKLERARALGAAQTINSRAVAEWGSHVMELTGGRGADFVVNMGIKSTIEQSIRSVGYEGTLVLVGGIDGYQGSIPLEAIVLRRMRVQGVLAGSRADFMTMCDFIEKHGIRPVIDRTYDFEAYEQAKTDLLSGDIFGKLVLEL